MRPTFTIRDLLWLTALSAVLLWSYRVCVNADAIVRRANQAEREAADWRLGCEMLATRLGERGF